MDITKHKSIIFYFSSLINSATKMCHYYCKTVILNSSPPLLIRTARLLRIWCPLHSTMGLCSRNSMCPPLHSKAPRRRHRHHSRCGLMRSRIRRSWHQALPHHSRCCSRCTAPRQGSADSTSSRCRPQGTTGTSCPHHSSSHLSLCSSHHLPRPQPGTSHWSPRRRTTPQTRELHAFY